MHAKEFAYTHYHFISDNSGNYVIYSKYYYFFLDPEDIDTYFELIIEPINRFRQIHTSYIFFPMFPNHNIWILFSYHTLINFLRFPKSIFLISQQFL